MSQRDNQQILSELLAAQVAGEAVVLATVIKARGSVPRHAGAKMLVYKDSRTSGTVGGGEMESRVIAEAMAALRDGRTRVLPYSLVEPARGDPGVCGGEVEIYLEPYLPPATLFIVGCGHVGRALADLAHWLGYQVVVTDDRIELASPEYIPHADVYLPGTIEEAFAAHPITQNTYIALVTRNVMIDRQVLPKLVNSPAPYIGVMGSKRRWSETKKLLRDEGLDETNLQRFHSPLGLELNAETPAEIAVSIMAEIIMLRRGGTGERMSE
ncbi:MAG TPA: XdhC family protein [Anaerolineae bacterium]